MVNSNFLWWWLSRAGEVPAAARPPQEPAEVSVQAPQSRALLSLLHLVTYQNVTWEISCTLAAPQ